MNNDLIKKINLNPWKKKENKAANKMSYLICKDDEEVWDNYG